MFDGKHYDFVQQYRLEFLQFPFSEHDDILDCHSQLFDGEFLQKGEVSVDETKDPEFDWWRNKAIEMKYGRTTQGRYVFGKKKTIGGVPSLESFR
jgi:hypothetical protein